MLDNSFTIIGSGSGFPQANRATAGYVLKIEDRLSLIDCGGGVTSSFLRRGFDPLSVDRVFISHTHPDHCCELPLFIQLMYLAGNKERLSLYLPEEFVEPFKAYLTAVYMPPEKLPFELECIGYSAGIVFDDVFRLTAIANNHLSGYAEIIEKLSLPNKMQSHSFLMEVNGKSVLYTADVADLGEIIPHLEGRDLVVMEATHIDLERFFELAPTVGVGQFVISHLSGDDESLRINQLAAKAGMDNLTTAIDGMEISL